MAAYGQTRDSKLLVAQQLPQQKQQQQSQPEQHHQQQRFYMFPTPRALSLSFSFRVKNRRNAGNSNTFNVNSTMPSSNSNSNSSSNGNTINNNHIYESPQDALVGACQTMPSNGKIGAVSWHKAKVATISRSSANGGPLATIRESRSKTRESKSLKKHSRNSLQSNSHAGGKETNNVNAFVIHCNGNGNWCL